MAGTDTTQRKAMETTTTVPFKNPSSPEKNALMTPDPYHVPGYGGFCPQFKYQIGATFGRTTSRLLRDDCVASSGRLVLAHIHPSKSEQDSLSDKRAQLLRKRTQSWGDQKLVEKMVPGYTGFIPKSQHYFGKRYAENCLNAISDFEKSQHLCVKRQTCSSRNVTFSDEQLGENGGTQRESKSRILPPINQTSQGTLEAVSVTAKPYMPKYSSPHPMSPYYMANDNPDKRFMSGYTGFVPRARGLLGAGYPLITHTALNEFTDETKRSQTIITKPISIQRDEVVKVDTKPIYHEEMGLVPHYTGHIPGQKFRYGNTFGHSTANALTKMNSSRSTAVSASG